MAHDLPPSAHPAGRLASGAPRAQARARERLRRQMRLAARFARFAAAGGNMQGLLDEACRVAAAGLRSGFAMLLVRRDDGLGFVLQAGTGWRDGLVGHARLDADTGTAAGLAWHTGRSVVSNDLAADARFGAPRLLAGHGIGSSVNAVVPGIGAPLPGVPGSQARGGTGGGANGRDGAGADGRGERGAGEDGPGEDGVGEGGAWGGGGPAFGVLEVGGAGPGAFTAEDACFLQVLACSVSVAVGRMARQAQHEAERRHESLRHQASLRELHHRVRNDLQGLCSGLEMEAQRAGAAQHGAFERMTGRVLALAGLYDHLLGTGAADTVAFAPYLRTLCARIAAAGGFASRSIALRVEAQSVALPRGRALQLAVAVNELVSNAAEHAFAGPGGGRITVGLLSDGGTGGLVVTVADDGRGFAGPRPGGAGLGFVERLVRQAGGTLGREDRDGTHWRIALPHEGTAG